MKAAVLYTMGGGGGLNPTLDLLVIIIVKSVESCRC